MARRVRTNPQLGVLALVGLLLGNVSEASDTEITRQSLKGLTTMAVVIEVLSPAAEQIGLTNTDLQTDAELKLRLAGIRVSTEDRLLTAARPYLYVNVNVGMSPAKLVVYSISITFNQNAQLSDPKKPASDPLAFTGEITNVESWSVGELRRREATEQSKRFETTSRVTSIGS